MTVSVSTVSRCLIIGLICLFCKQEWDLHIDNVALLERIIIFIHHIMVAATQQKSNKKKKQKRYSKHNKQLQH